MNKEYNRLKNEISPYLLSHANQSINWYGWGKEALDKAKQENKLLFISIGYSACSWCYEMSKKCFENEDIIDVLNQYYISVKVDKEERPDIDHFYLNAIRLMNDNGGWPITCIALPDGSPIYGGTSFSSNNLLEILIGLHETLLEDKENLLTVGKEIMRTLEEIDVLKEQTKLSGFYLNDIKLIIEPWKRKFDLDYGGTQSTPKFPFVNSTLFLSFVDYYIEDNEISDYIYVTLMSFIEGGIHDQLNGGFFRYAMDRKWQIPNLEKMLYDNAQMLMLYSYFYRYVPHPNFKKIIEETILFLVNEMKGEKLFGSSIASLNGEKEGSYYLWTHSELEKILSETELSIALDYFGIKEEGPFNGSNALFVNTTKEELSVKYSLNLDQIYFYIDSIKDKMKRELLNRKKPIVNSTNITSWNALLARGLLESYLALNDETYLNQALDIANYIIENLISVDFTLYRIKNSKKEVEGFMDDYANTINLFLTLYQLTTYRVYYEKMSELIYYTIEHFYDKKSGMFFYSSKKNDLPIRSMDFIDKSFPSSNSMMAYNLTIMTFLTGDPLYRKIAHQMISNMKSQMYGSGPFIAYWAQLMLLYTFVPIVAFTKKEQTRSFYLKMSKFVLPNLLIVPQNSIIEEYKGKYKNNCYCYYYYLESLDENEILKLKEFVIKNKLMNV